MGNVAARSKAPSVLRSVAVALALTFVCESPLAAATWACGASVPSGLRWGEVRGGWSMGVPSRPMTFRLHGSMIVTVVMKNVSDRALSGSGAECVHAHATDGRGATLPHPVFGCEEGVPMGMFPPGGTCASVIDLAKEFTVSSPGTYAVSLRTSMMVQPGPANAFQVIVAPHW
jgi:hypothetical protein